MKVQIYSDIHLEFYKTFPKIEPLADILFLAGDIGKLHMDNYKEFFDYVSKNWKYCFYVLGNHEYYHSKKTFEKLNLEYKEFFKNYNNIHLLDRDYYILDDILIIGCTMWTKVDNNIINIINIINDFQQIKIKENNRTIKMNIETFNNLHQKDKDFLLDMLIKNKSFSKIIILTHFPLIQENVSNPIYDNQPEYIKNYFSNNLSLETLKEMVYIISGHTHHSYHFKKDNITYISNQFGYKSELKNTNMKIDGLFDI